MQYVNDDMDELFKRAAENYPLDTNSADWNKVLAALQGDAEAKIISEKKVNKNGRLLWLLLLLPLGLICNQLYSPRILNNKKEISKTSEGNESQPSTTNNNLQQKNGGNSVTRNNTVNLTNIQDENLNDKKEIANTPEALFVHQQNTSYQSRFKHLKKETHGFSSNKNLPDNEAAIQNENSDDFLSEKTSYHRNYVTGIAFSKLLGNIPPTMVNRSFNPLFNSSDQNSKQPIQVARRRKFYVGAMGGIDATTIKFQKIEHAGMTYGLLLGYQINKRWSVESGTFLERKYYYSEGKYFNASKIYPSMPSNFWVDDISGDCKMIEVPLLVKNNFIIHKNSGWFATAGTSSYFMKKESYDYDVYYGSAGSYRRHKLDTTNATKNFFSNLSLSAGYTHRLGNFADLRIEPYVKVPLSGMGIGSVPLFSAGLQVGLTRKF